MVTHAEAKIHRVGPRHTLYLAKDLVEDSTFPFRTDEDLMVRIEGDALVVDRNGKTVHRTGRRDATQYQRESMVTETLNNLNFSPLTSKAERINQMLNEIHEAEVLESRIRHMPKNEHAIFLWEEEGFLDMVLSEFFDPSATGKAPKGLLSQTPSSFEGVNNLVMKDMAGSDRLGAMGKIKSWMSEIHSANETNLATRIAVDDYSWFLQNGSARALLELERGFGTRAKGNMTMLCGYNSSKIDPKLLEKLIDFHDCAIIDQPFRVYKR